VAAALCLPWGNTYAITWAALTGDGRVLRLTYPVIDPPPSPQITLAPGQTMTGTYKLSFMLDKTSVPANTDIAILWTYQFRADPPDHSPPQHTTSGVTWLHTPK
jgi:hypothetical protein